MMPTMQEIDRIEVEIKSCLNQLFAIHPELALDLCAAARRGVEVDAEIARFKLAHNAAIDAKHEAWTQAQQYCERAEKAEAALAEAVRREAAQRRIIAKLPDAIRGSTWKTPELRESAAVLVTVVTNALTECENEAIRARDQADTKGENDER